MTHKDGPQTPAQIQAALKQIEDEAAGIMQLLNNGRVPVGASREAQERLRALKELLDAEYCRMATIRGRDALSRVAAAFYWPAIQDAWANSGISGVRWNSRPGTKWSEVLYQVRFYAQYWAGSLERSADSQ
jgi:hypothetical protein